MALHQPQALLPAAAAGHAQQVTLRAPTPAAARGAALAAAALSRELAGGAAARLLPQVLPRHEPPAQGKQGCAGVAVKRTTG